MAYKNKEDQRAYHNKRYARIKQNDPERYARLLAASKKFTAKNPEYRREYEARNRDKRQLRWMSTRYKIAQPEMAKLLERRKGGCEVCKSLEDPHIDHDHAKPRGLDGIRGILCGHCNRVLGIVKDNPAILRALADYLEKTKSASKTTRASCCA